MNEFCNLRRCKPLKNSIKCQLNFAENLNLCKHLGIWTSEVEQDLPNLFSSESFQHRFAVKTEFNSCYLDLCSVRFFSYILHTKSKNFFFKTIFNNTVSPLYTKGESRIQNVY